MAAERARTDSVLAAAPKVITRYREARARVDTVPGEGRVDTLRVDTIPPNHVVVPIEFVRSADSLAVMVDLLSARIRTERLASDSLLKLQAIEIADLKRLNQIQRGSWTTKLKWAGVGAGLAIGAVTVLRN